VALATTPLRRRLSLFVGWQGAAQRRQSLSLRARCRRAAGVARCELGAHQQSAAADDLSAAGGAGVRDWAVAPPVEAASGVGRPHGGAPPLYWARRPATPGAVGLVAAGGDGAGDERARRRARRRALGRGADRVAATTPSDGGRAGGSSDGGEADT